MKLIYCRSCYDIIKLIPNVYRQCQCTKSRGRYVDRENAEVAGPCILLGFNNGSFYDAIHHVPYRGLGERFDAFVIPEQCDSVKRIA